MKLPHINRNILSIKIWIQKAENKILVAVFLVFGFFAVHSLSSKENTPLPKNEDSFSVDTVIPEGYVLVPIEIANVEPLSSLVGNTAVVDLFAQSKTQDGPGKKVGSRLKLVRAPLNPKLYAVLVREDDSERILAETGPYFVVIQNRDRQGSQVRKSVLSPIQIIYER